MEIQDLLENIAVLLLDNDLRGEPRFENCGSEIFLRLITLLMDRIWTHLPQFGRQKQGQKFC